MAYVIRAYHSTAQLPEKEEELAAIYRSVLEGKRALLLMDNARDAQQVAPLIPPVGCLLLVTSRKHFTLPGLFEKNLDKLPPQDARDLLLRIASRLKKEKTDQVEELARLCGYLPLALRAVGSALRLKKNISAEDYASRLTNTQQRLRLTETDAAMHSSYDLLSHRLQRRFRALAVFPDTFDVKAAAGIWEIDDQLAQERLAALLGYSLIEFDEDNKRYRLHDLVRLFVSTLLRADERDIAEKNHAEYYVPTMIAAESLYLKGGDSTTRGLALLDIEWNNIQAGQSWCAIHFEQDDKVAEWCCLYAGCAMHILFLRQPPRRLISWFEASRAAAIRLQRLDWEVRVMGSLGAAHLLVGENLRAAELFKEQLGIARTIGDRSSEGSALSLLGNVHHDLGEQKRTIDHFEKSLEIARETGDRRAEGMELANLGNVYFSLLNFRSALEFYKKSLEINQSLADRLGEGRALVSLARLHFAMDEPRRATEYYDRALRILREIGDSYGEGIALFNSSLVLYKLGNHLEAIARAKAALKILEAIESPAASTVRDALAKWRGEDKASGEIG
jgi:tetratricopeptide (TPR) repeat protein